MTLADFSHSLWSIFPPLLALSLALITRKVLLSLGVGIIAGALLLNDFSLQNSALYVVSLFKSLVFDDGAINSWNMSIVTFLVLLGVITALMTLSGGAHAFALWAQEKVKNKRGANLLAVGLGIFIFVDDYFNSLAVGAISRPVTDRFGTSRAKLAYILDSTAAPMCVISPISSWGAYIITVIGGILLAHNVTGYSAIGAFITMIPMNFYAIFALLLVFVVAYFNLNIGPMRQLEMANANLDVRELQMSHAHQAENELEIASAQNGKVRYLVLPILVLIVNTISAMIYTGAAKLTDDNKAFSILGAFENTDVGISLLFGSLTCLLVVLAIVFLQKLPVKVITKVSLQGANSMVGAIFILFFAWSIGKVIGDMQTGKYLSSFVSGSFAPQLLPALLFLLSGVMAFSTGTSWGTFGI
ncbi:MAG: Na+/H+ antiporter NhaC family protein, partial [Enterovibrio sp.]